MVILDLSGLTTPALRATPPFSRRGIHSHLDALKFSKLSIEVVCLRFYRENMNGLYDQLDLVADLKIKVAYRFRCDD